jgi:hypothetical protein
LVRREGNHIVESQALEIATRRYNEIKKTIASIHFKDHTDYDIFLELIMNVSTDTTIDFFTNDREFKIKGEHAYLLLVEKVSFDDTWFHISYRTNINSMN